MSKRNQIIKVTRESKALKALRIKSGHSLSTLADTLSISKGRVHQFEQGSIPDTWVTVYTGDIGNTFLSNGLSTGSILEFFSSK